MKQRKLTVWLYGEAIGELELLRNGRMRLRFIESALASYGAGSRVMSLSLPLTAKRVEGLGLDRFIEGLLPEHQVRRALEREHHVSPNDSFGLLAAIGAECAGAIQFLPTDTTPSDGELIPLTDDEVNEVVENLPTMHSPDGTSATASLGGVQAKVLLTRIDGKWAWPVHGAMSTHLVKPEPVSEVIVPHLIESEDWAARLAEAIPLKVARTQIQTFGQRKAIVVERYDRRDGQRLHQEDFTQALGLDASAKYEQSARAPGRLQQLVQLVKPHANEPATFMKDLLEAVAFNAIIGNSDAHSKNYSLLIERSGAIDLAPIYDAAPLMLISPAMTLAGHAVGGQPSLRYITLRHLVDEAESWGYRSRSAAGAVIAELASRVSAAAGTVPIVDELASIPEKVRQRAETFMG